VISTHHAPSLSLRDPHYQLIKYVMKPVIADRLLPHRVMDYERDRLDSTVSVINPTGAILVEGRKADSGLTDRKTIVAPYGGMGHHGGGVFSGKDSSKVDCAAAYMARDIAKGVVAAERADVCEIWTHVP
jgi:S-adenosylmethionine synthetase